LFGYRYGTAHRLKLFLPWMGIIGISRSLRSIEFLYLLVFSIPKTHLIGLLWTFYLLSFSLPKTCSIGLFYLLDFSIFI
jgi:hypothetical protein